jgi:hypothetical protein
MDYRFINLVLHVHYRQQLDNDAGDYFGIEYRSSGGWTEFYSYGLDTSNWLTPNWVEPYFDFPHEAFFMGSNMQFRMVFHSGSSSILDVGTMIDHVQLYIPQYE